MHSASLSGTGVVSHKAAHAVHLRNRGAVLTKRGRHVLNKQPSNDLSTGKEKL